ncbi:MAG TPA: glycosyltransferase family 4 protein [Acidimicrobiales bacterium]
MRIAVIAPPWLAVPPTAYGGTELVLDTLCRGLTAAGHDVLLFTTGDSTCPVERLWTFDEQLGLAQMAPAFEVQQVLEAYEAVKAWRPDVIHDHTVIGPVWQALDAPCPVVTTNHGPFRGVLLHLYRHVARKVPVVAISHHQAAAATDIPIRAVIHHGLDVHAFEPGSGAGGYALFLGRMNPEKGVHRAIELARKAGVPLKIAAKMREQPEREYFRTCVEPLLGGDVEYLGEVGGADKQALLGEAMCLLNPIAWPEPFGMVMIESLACGTPVVATPSGAAPEIIDDGLTGFLRSTDDELVAAITKAASLDRHACREVAVKRFSMERMARDHIKLYRSLIAEAEAAVEELETVAKIGASEITATGIGTSRIGAMLDPRDFNDPEMVGAGS